MQILTVVYGEKHVELFRRACLKSLSFPNNRSALYEHKAIWNICTDDKYVEYLRREIDIRIPELVVNFKTTDTLRNYIDPIQSAVIWQIEECLKTNSKLLIAPPDTIFGNGTVSNLLKIGREKNTCVVVPHPRVLPSILEHAFNPYISNPELVRLAWQHLHQAWSDAEIGHPRQNSYVGGVVWQRLADNLYSVVHRLPTIYLAEFTEEDLSYFKSQVSFGAFDHVWPGDVLVKRERQRYVASSDSCFIVEITEKDKNVPPIWPGDVDSFWRSHVHNGINKGIITTFRGE